MAESIVNTARKEAAFESEFTRNGFPVPLGLITTLKEFSLNPVKTPEERWRTCNVPPIMPPKNKKKTNPSDTEDDAESLKIYFNSAIENRNLKVDKLSKDITNLESSLEYSQQDISELKVNMATQQESLCEDFNETWEQTEEKARKILRDRLNLEIEQQFEQAHKTGRKRNLDGSTPSRPRTVICKLYDWKVKKSILKSARRLRLTST
ncbi:Hypothetical predicted protein [Paramuricea clavata]|uniref:Uncharacterized protein n=1 Tax=Paramuricea clavata TaxID=317549 RepID=A0A7D9DTW9_PARCT|nr:Hypothetical predicted protein [Paramuricea clavata]